MNGLTKRDLLFTHLRIGNWRNFSEANVELRNRVFLVGPNASGKSNLLDVCRFLHDVASVGGGFQSAVERRGGVSCLRCLAARRYSDIEIRVQLGSEEHETTWEYELHFNQDNLQRPIIKKERVTGPDGNVVDRPNDEDRNDPARLTQTYLEQVAANHSFRVVAEFFDSVRYLHVVPQLVREPDRSVGRKNDPYGGDFLEQIARTQDRIRTSRLARILEALRFAVPQLQELEMQRDDRGTPHLRGKYAHWRPSGAWQTEDQFSDGTLRLVGLLWALLDGNGPLLLEEPELSLHAEVVRFIPQLFARTQAKTGRQIFISTHSPDLLFDAGIGLDEILLLQPGEEGTVVTLANELADVVSLVEGGLNLPEAILPKTRPANVEQLFLFSESAQDA